MPFWSPSPWRITPSGWHSPIENNNVLIAGTGTIGLLIVMLVKAAGRCEDRRDRPERGQTQPCQKARADITVNPAVQDLDATLKEAGIRNNIHVAIECVGATPTCQTTVDYVKIQGRVVWVGNAAKMVTVNMQNIVTQELKIFGSYAFTEEDFSDSLKLLAERKLPASEIITRIVTLEHATETFEELTKGGSKDIKVLVDVNG